MLHMLARRVTTVSVCALAVLAATAVPAVARMTSNPVPIGHRQYFEGTVNGHSASAVVQVLCGGPATTGHPQGGQTVKVLMVVPPVTSSQGYTGTAADEIRAWLFWPTPTASAPARIATFTSYNVAMPIPVSIKVPCSGTGRMVFVPAPGSQTARPAVVHVTFMTRGV